MSCEFVLFIKAVFFDISLLIYVFTMPKLVTTHLMIKIETETIT